MSGEPATEDVLLAEFDGWAELTLNRPQHHNALSTGMAESLLHALEHCVSEPNIRVVVISGAGRSFCVGGDLNEFSSGAHVEAVPAQFQVGDLRRNMRVVQLLRESPLVSIAAINGACAGAGLAIAAACDLRLTSASAVFRTAFIDAGLPGDFGGAWTLSRLLGEAKARELYLLNEKVDAATARDIGLVSRICEPDDLTSTARTVASDLAAKAPLALASMKVNLAEAGSVELSTACDREAERHVRSGRSKDAVEAASAWLEKRTPRFTGS